MTDEAAARDSGEASEGALMVVEQAAAVDEDN